MGIKQQGSPEFYEIVFKWLASETGLRAVETRLLERQAEMCAEAMFSVLNGFVIFLLLRLKVSPVHTVTKRTCYNGSPGPPTNRVPCLFPFLSKNLTPGRLRFDGMLGGGWQETTDNDLNDC